MSAPTKQRARIQHDRGRKCAGDTHEFPRPRSGRRPCVVFCTRCQHGKDAH